MMYQKKPRHECGLTAQAYAREVAQCALADERMKEIDRKIALLTYAEREARRNRIEADRHIIRQGTPEFLAMMQTSGAGDEVWVTAIVAKTAKRTAQRAAWLEHQINALPCYVKL